MDTFKIIGVLIMIVIGIPIQIIDYKHRKNKAYEPGDAWAYYSKLSKEGSKEGKFMMYASYLAIAFLIAVIGFGAYQLSAMNRYP
jgi:hypothetical protein